VAAILLIVLSGLALADASVVTLALPPILNDLSTTVQGVAAVIGVYTAVLAVGLAVGIRRPMRGGAVAGAVLFAAGSLVCALAGTLAVLLVGRALQAAGAAAVLPAAFARLDGAGRGRRVWLAATVFGTAAGPALGGALTQAFSWRAIFAVQVPVALAAALAAAMPSPDRAQPASTEPMPTRRAVALGALAASLTSVLFLLVLLLVVGWSLSPLGAAGAVSVLPVTALGAYVLAPGGEWRAVAGCLLVGAGTLCLAFVPTASVGWIIVPQVLAGAGMGLALPALAGHDDAPALAVRAAGITLALLALAPIVAGQLNSATERAKERGVALILDSSLPPLEKVKIGPPLAAGVNSQDPRDGLRRAVRSQVAAAGANGPQVAALGRRADETLVRAVGEAFRIALLITGGLALVAAALAAGALGRRERVAALIAAGALAAPIAYAGLFAAIAPTPPALADPCHPPPAPSGGGALGLVQAKAFALVDRAACRLHASREKLVLALFDPTERQRFKRRYGVDPLTFAGALRLLLPR
jgi:Major Facilitator Superfamily